MKALIAWLDRLATLTPEHDFVESKFQVTVPGFEPLDISNWLLSVDPKKLLPHDIRASCPESLSLIRLLDIPGHESSISERHRLGADLACFISLALDRKVVIPHEIGISVPQLNEPIFLPVIQVIDRGALGPLPDDPKGRLQIYLTAVFGLGKDDLAVIGAAASVYHGALVLFDRDARAAYTLLIAGIEVLSRQYGSPPTDWTNWEQSASWETFITSQKLTTNQAGALRKMLMKDKQLRLKATFCNYAASGLSDRFWDKPWQEWIYGLMPNDSQWLPATPLPFRIVADLLPKDRIGLRKALGLSYDLRSAVVHQADWVEILSLAQPPVPATDLNRPLPFAILRAILAELIWIEISAHSTPRQLPDFQLLR
jgi:hypothetical protein